MNVFFGASIQGHEKRGDRAEVYGQIMAALRELGHKVLTEHTAGKDQKETLSLMEDAIGKLPEVESERLVYVRNKMIEFVESDIGAAVFEASHPSLGTGVEIAHAYLRPRLGLKAVPVIILYEKNYWPNNLTTMIRGITPEVAPHLKVVQYNKGESFREIFERELS